MAKPAHNAAYEAKKKQGGWVRAPRITAEAGERLRVLSFRYRLNPSDVVTRLLLGEPLESGGTTEQERLGMSDEEYDLLQSARRQMLIGEGILRD